MIVYESARISGVFQELNISTIQKIERIHSFLKFYEEFSKAPMDKLLAIDSETKISDVYRILELLKYDILNSEKSILKALKVSVTDLKEITLNRQYRQ